MTFVELCAGTASVSLWALAQARPLCGMMGSKRRWAPLLAELLELTDLEHVVLVDAGPWGDLWQTLSQGGPQLRADLARVLEAWGARDPAELWRDLVSVEPMVDGILRVAQFLFLQSRAAGSLPVRWDGGVWRSGALGRISCKGAPKDGRWGSGRRTGEIIARRLLDLEPIWSRVEIVHGDARKLEPIAGATVYIDPPYVGCPRYAAQLPRRDVLELALDWQEAGARVAVSEAVPLELLGWSSVQLPHRKPEHVTASWPIRLPVPRPPSQLELWSAA